jgi:hypothetical protein
VFMQKILKHCTAVLGGVIFIGFGIQIVLGILWMCNAFIGLGIGEGIVCVGELLFFGGAVLFLTRCIRAGRLSGDIALTLAVVTFPMVLQSLMEVDSRVWTGAMLLFEVGCVLRAGRDFQKRRFLLWALCFWLAAGLLRREYLYIGAVPMLLLVVSHFLAVRKMRKSAEKVRGRYRSAWNHLLLVLAAGGIIAGVGSFYREPVNLAVHAASRLAWTELTDNYEHMPYKKRIMIYDGTLRESSYEADGIAQILYPSLEKNRGSEEAESLLWKLSATAWETRKGQIVKEIAWDMAGYLLPPEVLQLQLQGRAYESYAGMNYRQILMPAPRLGKIYMDYSCWWFGIALVLRVLLWLLEERRAAMRECVVIVFTGLFMALLYTMNGAGRMDYKNTLFILCAWLVWLAQPAVSKTLRTRRKPDEKER